MDDKSVPSPGPITVQPAPAVAGRPLNDWQVPLLSCCSPLDLTCLEGFFCPCFLYGKIVHRRTDPDLTNYGYFNAACCVHVLMASSHLAWILTLANRRRLRVQYGINNGEEGKDCLVSYFCGCCELIQEDRDIVKRRALQAAALVDETKQGYQPQENGMVYNNTMDII